MPTYKRLMLWLLCLIITSSLTATQLKLPRPIYELNAPSNPLEHAVFNQTQNAIWTDHYQQYPTTVKLPKKSFNPKSLTITTWLALDSPHLGYRQIAFKAKQQNGSRVVDFKFGLYDRILEFGFQDHNEAWQGILRAGTSLVCSGQRRIPLAKCTKLAPRQWHFCAVTFKEGDITLILNQDIVATAKTAARKLLISDAPLRLGHGLSSDGFPTFHLGGFISHFQIYDQALTTTQLHALYQTQKHEVTAIPLDSRKFKENFEKQRDPQFKRKLDIVKDYEKHTPETQLPERPSDVEIIRLHGIPTLHRNGIPESGMCMMPACTASNRGVFNSARDFAAAGVDYVSEIFWPWLKLGDNCSLWWLAPGRYDFPKIEARLQSIIDANPNARILVRWKMNVPDWWLREHKDQLSVTHTGQRAAQPSFASKKWLDDACTMLYDVTAHLENSRFARHIVGYLIAGGETSEWFWWGYAQGLVDYSEVALQDFRQWLTRKYRSDQALQHAWKLPQASLKSATIPTPKQRKKPEDPPFRDVTRGATPALDYVTYLSDTTTNCISQAARATRKALKTPKLIGSFHGYSIYFLGQGAYSRLEFQNLARVLKDPNVDFLCAPTTYATRRGGQEGSFIVGYTASLRLHGKLYWDEADLRTHLCTARVTYRTTTPTETTEVNWRTFGNALTQGTNLWWFLIAGNDSFHDNKIMNDIKKMATLDKAFAASSKKSIAQVAVLSDENSMRYITPDAMISKHTRNAMTELPKSGVPYDTYLLDDLEDMPDYRLYVFLNAYFLSQEQQDRIHRKIARNHAVALWLYAPGYVSDKGNSTTYMTRLTGFQFQRFNQKNLTDISFLNSSSPVKAIRERFTTGFQIVSLDPKATVFAVSSDGRTLAAERPMTWGTSVFLATPVTGDFLRHLCHRHHIHVFSETGDIFRANESFIMIHANTQGQKSLTLPQGAKLKNLRTDAILEAMPTCTFPMKYGETNIFQILK